MQLKTILFGMDFSDSSKNAFLMACSLGRDHGGRLIVLHVVPRSTYEITSLAQLGLGESEQQFDNEIRRGLQGFQPPDDRVPVDYRLVEGDPGAKTIEVAIETACDLIVLGTHGRTGFRMVLMGSVAEHVMRNAPRSVLVARGSAPDAG